MADFKNVGQFDIILITANGVTGQQIKVNCEYKRT